MQSGRFEKAQVIPRNSRSNLMIELGTPAPVVQAGMLNLFSFAGKSNNNNKDFQFCKQDYHPIELNTAEKLKERLDYLHENPVRSGLVWES